MSTGLTERLDTIETLLDQTAGKTLSTALKSGLNSSRLIRCPSDYYNWPLSQRANFLNARSENHLCKTLLMTNTRCINDDCSNKNNSKYYAVVVQYTEKLNSALFHEFLKSLPGNEGLSTIKHFNLRLISDEEAYQLTGYQYNAVAPFGLTCGSSGIPVIVAKSVMDLVGEVFVGAGEVDVKLGLLPYDFEKIGVLIADITLPR
ncbi:hypothetical protein GEMRC1_012444 [Eukaryota sp. GEM-RC1]